MAILKFPVGSHLGSLFWEEYEEVYNTKEIENLSSILYYMGYQIFPDFYDNGIHFVMRQKSTKIDPIVYRNLLFDFTILFNKITINLPDSVYAKMFLGDFFIPIDKRIVTFGQELFFHNETLYLAMSNNCLINGVDYNNGFFDWAINHYENDEPIIPIIAEEMTRIYTIKIQVDLDEGLPLNDPFTNYNFDNVDDIDEGNDDDYFNDPLPPDDNPENDLPF